MRGRLSTAAVVLAVLATAALSMAIERAGREQAHDPVPSTTNGDPRGLLAAYRYLEDRGVPVARVTHHFLAATRGRGVLVLAAPVERVLTDAEARAVAAFARRGGVVVVAGPTGRALSDVQPALADALGITGAPARMSPDLHPPGRDPSMAVRVVAPDPLVGGARRLVARVAEGERLQGGTVLAEAGDVPVVSRRDLGAGRVYALATPTLLENHRLDLGDDLWLVEGLGVLARSAGGPVRFDEVHHLAAAEAGSGSILATPALLAAGIQLALVGALVLFALGRRFGPVRPLETDLRRSSLEYVDTLAALYRQSRDDPGLRAAVYRDLRRRLQVAHGIPESLDDAAVARRLAAGTDLTEAEARARLAPFADPAADLLPCVQAAAELEARLAGRDLG